MSMVEASDLRLTALQRWIRDDLGFASCRLEPASADASFRRYFRLSRDADSYIVMDAPPDKEDVGPFVRVAQLLADLDLQVPLVLAQHRSAGFLLLTDLGTRQYLDALRVAQDVERLYGDALTALATMQTRGRAVAASLPAYDDVLLHREMELLPQWFLTRHLGLELDAGLRALLDRTFATLASVALSQPVTFVHRDFHSRNLMVLDVGNPGIIDFQDAVAGPLTYDLVSLLKDCYIVWPAARVRVWALEHRRRLIDAGFALDADEAEFLRWFDLMGLQRHIKVLGIFCRLFYRDGKSRYLQDLPLVLQYTSDAAAAYPQTAEFAAFLRQRVAPLFAAAQARALGRA
jgi:aminoglycoside/choline kinase family phosphotransferase